MSARISNTELIKKTFYELMKNVGTSIPGHFLSFDPATQLAQIQIGLVRVDINGQTFTPPPLIECPVAFMGGSEYLIEHQIDPGDECLIVFSQRCIDGWLTTGGVAQVPIVRFHDFSDAAILPGLRSQPNKIANFQNNGVRLRNKTGDKFIWLKNDGTAAITVDTLVILANIEHTGNTEQTGDVTLTGNVDVTGDTSQTGTITATTDVVGGGKSLKTHTHSGVTPGGGVTGPPV